MDYSSCEEKSFTPGQIQKMYDFFMDNRSSIKICKSTQYKLGFDIKFDSSPSQNTLSYTTWGDSSRLTFSPIENSEKINFANKQVLGYKCVDRFSTYQVTLTDSGNDGIQAPGYFAFTADGKDLVRGNVPARSYLFSIDAQCPAKESRLRLELAFGDFPGDLEWKIFDVNDKSVIDHTATTGKGFSQYNPNFAGLTLIFEKCLAAGPYRFRIENTYGETDMAPGYYKLILNSQQIKFSNALSSNPDDTSFTVKAKIIACFSGDSLVQVLAKGRVRMKDLILGDKVHVGNNVFEPVYSFGHRNSDVKADYIRVRTERSTIVISEDHMIFSDLGNAIAARLLKVGDKLLHGSGDILTVQDIAVISAEGAYAPFTPSGKIVVNDVVASSFVAFGNGSTMKLAGFRFSFHWLAHTFETPHRFYCTYISNCKSEAYNDEGISYWVDIPHQIAVWIFSQKGTVHSFLTLLIVIYLLALFVFKLLTQNLFILILATIAFKKVLPVKRNRKV
jgi:Hint module